MKLPLDDGFGLFLDGVGSAGGGGRAIDDDFGLVFDGFAGGGGASTGIEAALQRAVDIAVNHSELALTVHKANHPETEHHTADVWDRRVHPLAITKGRRVRLAWFSPDCTHFSRAKGGKPLKQKIRSLAWVVIKWAKFARPDVIMLENVPEFPEWGPLGPDNLPIESRKGETYRRWRRNLERLGYVVDTRVLTACDFGAPTKRKRFFLVARRDGLPIRWPTPTHGPGRLPYRSAADIIDWSIPCPSIFERKRPLAEKTLWRIAQGIRRFVLENPRPFIVGVGGRAGQSHPTPLDAPVGTVTAKNDRAVVAPHLVKVNHGGRTDRSEQIDIPLTTITAARRGHALVAPTLVQTGYGERARQRARYLNIHEPLGTVVAKGGKHALVSAFLAKHFGGVVGIPATQPVSTITAKDHHSLAAVALAKFRGTDPRQPGSASVEDPLPTISAGGIHVAEVRAFLTAYYGSTGEKGQDLFDPTRTITAKARLGLVTVEGVDYQITDIGMRMLEPHELLGAQFGRFAASYDISAAKTKAAQVRLIGNSVCPEVAEALVSANLPGAQRRAA